MPLVRVGGRRSGRVAALLVDQFVQLAVDAEAPLHTLNRHTLFPRRVADFSLRKAATGIHAN